MEPITKNLARIVLYSAIVIIFLTPLGYQQGNPQPAGIKPIEVGSRPAGVAVDSKTDRVAVANRDSNDVSVIDLSTGDALRIAVGQRPEGVAIRPAQNPNDTALAVVANSGDNTISVIDLDNLKVSYTLEVGKGPFGVAVHAGANRAVVTNSDSNNVSVVDLEGGKVVATIDVETNPKGVAVNPTTNMAVVANRDGDTVSIIDLKKNQVLETVEVDSVPESVAINPEIGTYGMAAVTNSTDKGGQVTLINLEDFTVALRIDVDPEPTGIAINPVTNLAVVTHKKLNSVSLVNLDDGNVLDSLAVGSEPLGVAVHPDVNQALVTDNGAAGVQGGLLELIQLSYPVPSISDVSPQNVVVGSPEFRLMINGSKFFRASTVSWDGMILASNFVSSKQLAVQVPASLISQVRRVAVTVTNPGPDGGTSAPAAFTINNPVPRIDRITPNERPAGGPGFELTVLGAGFVRGPGGDSQVRFNNAPKPTTFVGPGELRVQIAAADLASPGIFPVVVTNPQPDGISSDSNTANFTNASPPPTLVGFSPGGGPAGTPVTISGTSFVSVPAGNTLVTFAGPADTRVAAVISGLANNEIRTIVPLGAVTGKIRVATPRGSALSQADFAVTLPVSFTVAALPAMAEVPQGDGTTFDVRVESRDGFTGLVNLSASGLPAGVSAQFSPSQLAPGSNATLQVRVDNSAATGRFNFRVQGWATISGTPVINEANVSIEVLSGRLTTVSGRVVTSDDIQRPLVDVEVSVVRFEAQPPPGRFVTIVPAVRTNAAGNFLLRDVPVGRQMLLVNGATARDPQHPERRFPPVEEPVTIVSSQANPTPFTIHLPAIDQTSRTATPPNPPSDIRATTQTVPNLEVRIPAGTTITTPDGTVATEITLTPVPTDRAPGLLPPGVIVPMLFSLQPGGAVPSQPVPVSFPNLLNTPPGTQMNLWTFDVSISEWRVYGTGTVSLDGKQVVPDIDPTTGRPFGLRRFAWHMPAPPPPCAGQNCCRGSHCCAGGDPVALASGAFFEQQTDIILGGRVPISIARLYQTGNTTPGPFGLGTLDINYGHRIQQEGTSLLYIVPSSRPFRFTPTGTPNQFENTTDPSLRGAVLTRDVTQKFSFTLRMKNGTVQRFDRIVTFANVASLRAIVDRNGNTITLTRISPGPGRLDLLTEVRSPDGLTLRLDYDGNGRVTAITDPIGRRVAYTYNAAEYLATVTNPEGGVTRYNYDAQGRMTEITNPRAMRVVLNEYDGEGRIRQQTHADGSIFRYEYRVVGGLITEVKTTDPRGGTTTYRFNCMSYPVSITDANGQARVLDRSIGTNRINFLQDALGRKNEFRYDGRGNIVEIKDPSGATIRLEYEPTFNQVTRMIDKLTNATTMRYDSQGNLLEIVDSENNSTTFTYNSFGQMSTMTDALGNVSRLEYDSQGQLLATIDAEGNRRSHNYDQVGRLRVQTDPRGQKIRFSYDAMDRIVRIVDPRGVSTQFTYDLNSNLVTVTDPRGSTIRYAYDNQDRLERRTDQLGNFDVRAYDENGNLIRFTDRRGHVTNFTHDALNRLTRTTRSDGSATEQAYDTLGRVNRITDSMGGGIEFSYDSLDRLVREVTARGAISYEYDATGHRTRMRVAGQPDVIYGYDHTGRLRQVQQGSDMVLIDYDRVDRQTKLTFPNGMTTEYTYDRAGRLTNLTYKRRDGSGIDTISYTYDGSGNRTGARGTTPYGMSLTPVATTVYNQANQLLRSGDRSFTYDRNGNLATQTDARGATQYEWDTRNRLTAISGPDVQARFDYDTLGRRIRKEINGQSTGYLYDGLNIIQEFSDARALATYLRGVHLDETYTRIEGARKSHYPTDALNSTLFLTDDSGARVQQYAYDPFGRIVQQSPDPLPVNQPLTYTGREWDSATGLYYYRARYYDPTLGRFLSEDPIKNLEINLYAYAESSPTNFIDPTGEVAVVPLALVIIGTGGLVTGGFKAIEAIHAGKSFGEVLGAFGHGFVAGAVGTGVGMLAALGTGNPFIIGAAAGLANNLTDQLITQGGRLSCLDAYQAIRDTALGTVAGGLASRIPILGTRGRLPNLWKGRALSDFGKNSLRLIGAEEVGDLAQEVTKVIAKPFGL